MQLARFVKSVPVALFGDQAIFLTDPNRGIYCKDTIGLGIVVFTVQLIETVGHFYTVDGEVELAVFFNDLLLACLQIRNEHLAVGLEVVHTALHAIGIVADPHSGIFVHLAAAGVEQVVVTADFGEAKCQSAVIIVVDIAVSTSDKAGSLQLARFVKSVPVALFGDQAILLTDPGSNSNNQNAVGLGVVVFSLQLIETIGHLHAVECKIQLAVLFDDFLLAVLQIRNKHLTVRSKIVHARLYAIAVGRNPHCGILCHLTVAIVKQIVIIAYLGKALCSGIVAEIVGFTFNVYETVPYQIAVLIAPILARAKLTALLRRIVVDVAAPILVDKSGSGSEDDTAL